MRPPDPDERKTMPHRLYALQLREQARSDYRAARTMAFLEILLAGLCLVAMAASGFSDIPVSVLFFLIALSSVAASVAFLSFARRKKTVLD